jgi:biopolymer transport protein ExbB/TolQ
MWEVIWFLVLGFSIFVWPVWMYRRMKKVQRQLNATREETDTAPHYRDKMEDLVKREGNLTMTKSLEANEDLIAADKKAREMPDIVKTLEGRR